MSTVVIDRSLVHYETYGQGDPVILVHGWLGSWRYWMPTMKALAAHGYHAYGLDLWGFGDSDRSDADRYTITDYAYLIAQFMDKIGIEQATYIGHSMGGLVGTKLILLSPHKVKHFVVVASPIVGRTVSFYLRLLSEPHLARLVWGPQLVQRLGHRILAHWLAGTWRSWYNEIVDDTLKVTREAANLAMYDMIHTDLSPQLPSLNVPILAIYGKRDNVVDPRQANLFRNLPVARLAEFEHSKHFPMLDEPERFNTTLLRWLDERKAEEKATAVAAGTSPKPLWRRRRPATGTESSAGLEDFIGA